MKLIALGHKRNVVDKIHVSSQYGCTRGKKQFLCYLSELTL